MGVPAMLAMQRDGKLLRAEQYRPGLRLRLWLARRDSLRTFLRYSSECKRYATMQNMNYNSSEINRDMSVHSLHKAQCEVCGPMHTTAGSGQQISSARLASFHYATLFDPVIPTMLRA